MRSGCVAMNGFPLLIHHAARQTRSLRERRVEADDDGVRVVIGFDETVLANSSRRAGVPR
jgi:hypothetical protein